jgi:hypothetical protein
LTRDASAATDTIAVVSAYGGELYLGGNRMNLPYRLSCHRGLLAINGLQLPIPEEPVIVVSDSVRAQSAVLETTAMRILPTSIGGDSIEVRVREFVAAHYHHGMPRLGARRLGGLALPALARLLREETYKEHWHKVAGAIGCIGDPAYFDTLRSFIWDRFHGPIDLATFSALQTAQANLGVMASTSQRALDYLLSTAAESPWLSVPWYYPRISSHETAVIFATHTKMAIARTDSDIASAFLRSQPIPTDRYAAHAARSLLETNDKVRHLGFESVWER